jgi:DNA-binding GntR family transcriptional regulator
MHRGEPLSVALRHRTLVEVVEAELKRMLLEGELPPGEPLNQVQIASQLGVSRTVVREAIRSLAVQGLLELRSRRRSLTAPLSRRRLEEMLAVRQELEAVAVRWATPAMGPERLRYLWALYERMVGSEAAGDEWLRLDRLFHRTIYETSGNSILASMLDRLRDQITRYMKLAWPTWNSVRGANARAEHFELLRALESGDVDAAEAAIRGHLRGTTSWLLRQFDEWVGESEGVSRTAEGALRDAERAAADER